MPESTRVRLGRRARAALRHAARSASPCLACDGSGVVPVAARRRSPFPASGERQCAMCGGTGWVS